MTEDEMRGLREAIKKKYEECRSEKPGKYPKIKFNSYPASYTHLQGSIKEELAKYGQTDTQQAIDNIPSTKIFAKIFHENYILKDEKILDTCYLYAWGKTRDAFNTVVTNSNQPVTRTPATSYLTNRTYRGSIVVVALLLVAGLVVYGFVISRNPKSPATGLVIDRPATGKTVPMKLLIEGRVLSGDKTSDVDTVWIVVRALKFLEYYVQQPIKVEADGTWKGAIYIGGYNKAHIGVRSLVRAFAHPAKFLEDGKILYAWPESKLSSNAIEVVRGPQEIDE